MTDIRPSKQIVFDKEKTITLTSYNNTLNNHQIIKDENYNSTIGGWMIKLTKGKLVLKNITLYGSDIEQSGGALHGDNNAQIELLKGTTISHFKNTTTYGSAVRIEPSNKTYTQNDYNLIIDGARIEENFTQHSGGGIYINYNSKGIMKNGMIINNYAANSGGGIIVLGKLDLYGGTINGNIAEGDGGAIATQYYTEDGIEYAGEINMYGKILISNNIANRNCGAIFINKKGKLTMNGGVISNNTATSSVGGIYKASDATFNYNSGIICENTPSNEYETHASCPS